MASSTATTVEQYLDQLPPDRRAAMARIRDLVNRHVPAGFEEGMQFGMIYWFIPLSRFPDTYNGKPLGVAALASQKQYMALHLTAVYGDPQLDRWFRTAFTATGKRLDMGKGCVRFKSVDDLPLDVIGEVIARVTPEAFLARYQAARAKTARPTSAKLSAKRTKPSAKPKPSKPKPSKPRPSKPTRRR